jgi:protein DGCR14
MKKKIDGAIFQIYYLFHSTFRPSPKFGAASKSERLSNLSPAAQRLASAKLGIRTNTDKALRDSYTPSPSHRLPGDKTPLSLTPGSGRHTPGSSRSSSSGVSTPGGTPKRDGSQISSLTDNLLNLPKRPRAKDYF